MTVDPVTGLEGEEGADAHDDGAEPFVPEVEVGVRRARPLPFDGAIVGVRGGVGGPSGTESGARFHALEDEVHPEPFATFHTEAGGPDQVFVLDLVVGLWAKACLVMG